MTTAGAHQFDDVFAAAFFHQHNAGCLIEPSLPFAADPQDLREGLRLDPDCKDYTFDPVCGGFDYRNCLLIVPQGQED